MAEWPTLKRVLDVAVAGATLVVGAPVIAVASAAIVLESPGPALFQHLRVGRKRQPLHTLKLRTMIVGAEQLGPGITADRDPRITRIGRWLRKSKLDELPQLWNVLRGEMSLVGPRPEIPRYADGYPEALFEVRPGLTDLASLAFRDEESLLALAQDRERAYREVIVPLKLGLALEGVQRSSPAYDLWIVARTVFALVARAPDDPAVLEARRRIEQLNASGDA